MEANQFRQAIICIFSMLISTYTLLASGSVQFTASTYEVDENAETLTIEVSRIGDTASAASVDYNSSGTTATATEDYTPVSGTLNWNANDGDNKNIEIPILDDAILESDEVFTVALSNAIGVSIGTTDTATITLVDIEEGLLSLTSNVYSVTENEDMVTITVVRVNGSDGEASIDYTTVDGTATAGSDYSETTGTLVWEDGDFTNKTFDIPISNDEILEEDETVEIQIINPVGADVGSFDIATLTISDYNIGELQFSSANYYVFENAGTVAVTVQRVNGTDDDIAVSYTITAGTASSDDYTASSGTLDFADGESIQTFDIDVIGDDVPEPDETMTLALSSPTGGATLAEQSTATFTILNDDEDYSSVVDDITPSLTDIYISNAIDLSDGLPNGGSGTLLEAINSLNTLQQGGLEIEQDTGTGRMRLDIGSQSYHFFPIRVLMAEPNATPGMFIDINNEALFYTDNELIIVAPPVVADFESLLEQLQLLDLLEYTIEENGDLNIPTANGAPPLVVNEDGEVVIANEYFDRFIARPDYISEAANPGIIEGLNGAPHPDIPTESIIVIGYMEDNSLRQQRLFPAPVESDTLENLLSNIDGITNVNTYGTGMITATYAGHVHRLIADYYIRKNAPPDSETAELSFIADQNNDGITDIQIIYSDGETQIFFYYPP